jgi:dsRNA-specific ribonuclease
MSSIIMSKTYIDKDYTITDKYLTKKKKVIEESISEAKVYDINLLSFKKFISTILQKYGKLSPKSVDRYTNADNIRQFMASCTHWSFDLQDNYEFYEVLGDSTLNTVIVWYYVSIFPELQKMDKDRATYLMSKLKQKGIQKEQFAEFCEQIGLSDFIRYRELHYVDSSKRVENMIIKDKSMKEDVFEAFFGCLNNIVNNEEDEQIGYILVNQIMINFLNEIGLKDKLSLDPRKLEEGISMLKELFDVLVKLNNNNKSVFSQVNPEEKTINKRYVLTLKLYLPSNNFQLVEQSFYGEGMKKSVVEEELSQKALQWLEKSYGMRWDYKNVVVPYNV